VSKRGTKKGGRGKEGKGGIRDRRGVEGGVGKEVEGRDSKLLG